MDSNRLKRLERMIAAYKDAQRPTTFLLENRNTFTTRLDPLSYLVENGTETPVGRIVAYPHPVDGIDPLSRSLYETIDEEILTGALRTLVAEVNASNEQEA